MAHAARAIRDGACDVVVCRGRGRFRRRVSQRDARSLQWVGARIHVAPGLRRGERHVCPAHTSVHGATTVRRARTSDVSASRFARMRLLQSRTRLFKVPLTMADYLNAKPIADPLRLYDCVMPCVGRRRDRAGVGAHRAHTARAGDAHPCIRGDSQLPGQQRYSVPGGWEGFTDRLYDRAGCRPADLHFAQLYDDYPVMCFVQLEGLGICPKGSAHQFVRSTDITTKGAFPINTGGGQLSAGQAGAAGGMIGVYEGATQLLGRAGARQVKCKRGVVAGYGMVAYGRGLCSSAAVLERVE